MSRSLALSTLAAFGLLATAASAQTTAAPATKPVQAAQQPAAKPAMPAQQPTATKPAEPTRRTTAAARTPTHEMLDLNLATREQLVSLPGIGETYADAVIKGRPYTSKSQLVQKKVIPESAYKKIEHLVVAKQVKHTN